MKPTTALSTARPWLPSLFERCTSPDAGLVLLCALSAARVTREPFVLMVPLIWLESTGAAPHVISEQLPPVRCLGDLPLYALDKHTRVGRTAIRRFAAENRDVLNALSAVPKHARLHAAYKQPFTPMRHRWTGSSRCRRPRNSRSWHEQPTSSAPACLRPISGRCNPPSSEIWPT